MKILRLTAISALLVLTLLSVTLAQNTPTETYSNDASGFRRQIEEIVVAADSEDNLRLQTLVQNMVLVDASAWATANIGTHSPDLTTKYAASAIAFQARLLGQVSRRQGDPAFPVQVSPFQIPNTISPQLRSSPGFTIATPYRIQFGPDLEKDSLIATFVYSDGAQRFAGWGIFPIWVEHPLGLSADGRKITPPVAIHTPDPKYPKDARGHHIQGTVEISVVVGIDGNPHDLKIVSGDPEFRNAALQAVNQWKFKPQTTDGTPTEATITVKVYFRLY
jgi:TonB family protein